MRNKKTKEEKEFQRQEKVRLHFERIKADNEEWELMKDLPDEEDTYIKPVVVFVPLPINPFGWKLRQRLRKQNLFLINNSNNNQGNT